MIVAADRNSFVLKILTFNPLVLKILQIVFADPAPVKAFRWGRGEGDTPCSHEFPKSKL